MGGVLRTSSSRPLAQPPTMKHPERLNKRVENIRSRPAAGNSRWAEPDPSGMYCPERHNWEVTADPIRKIANNVAYVQKAPPVIKYPWPHIHQIINELFERSRWDGTLRVHQGKLSGVGCLSAAGRGYVTCPAQYRIIQSLWPTGGIAPSLAEENPQSRHR